MDLETTEWGLNYGVPLTLDDAPWILVAEHYVKDKANGFSGLLVSLGGVLYLKHNNAQMWMRFNNVEPKHPFALQVEIVGEIGGTICPKMILSDPLFFGDDYRGRTFATRLTRFNALRPTCPGLMLVDPGVWTIATPHTVGIAWELAEEGICLQPLCALPVTYKNSSDQRGSMRSVKKIQTVDIDGSSHGVWDIGGNSVELKSNHGPGVAEYHVTSTGLQFHRMRPDKKKPNSEHQLKRLGKLIPIDVLKELLANRTRAPNYALVEYNEELFDKPGFLSLLVALVGVNIVASTRLLEDTIRLKSLQSALVVQLATNSLPPEVREVLTHFGYRPDTITRPIALPDLVRAPLPDFTLLMEEYMAEEDDSKLQGPFLVSPYDDQMLARVNAMMGTS